MVSTLCVQFVIVGGLYWVPFLDSTMVHAAVIDPASQGFLVDCRTIKKLILDACGLQRASRLDMHGIKRFCLCVFLLG